jgi:hypothetical protein
MKQPTPDPLMLTPGEALRFALGSPSGPRSSIWTVFGSKHTDDVYIGARDTLQSVKLSLHQSGKWRRALTSQEAERLDLPNDVDRVMGRWEVPEPIGEGWIHAVSIAVPSSSIQTEPPPLKRPKRGGLNFYEMYPGSHQLRFDILIKNAGAPELRAENIHARVGRIQLPSGGCAWVMATEFIALNDRAEADIENLRNLTRKRYINEMGHDSFREYERPVGLAWGSSDDNGRPVMIDLGDLREQRALPSTAS